MAMSPKHAGVIWAASFDGFVFASYDGGVSWEEGRLITGRAKFFGAIRPSRAPNGADGNVEDLFRVPGAPQSRFSIDEGYDFPYGTTGIPYLEFGPDTPAFWPAVDSADVGYPRAFRLSDTGGGGGAGGGDASRFGIGIVRAAPRLQALLKFKRARLLGLNLKLLLNLRGTEPTWVNHIAIHPVNPKIALVATAMGVFKTMDGGVGWDHVFSGRNNTERWCNFIAFDQREPDKVYLGSGQGLLISHDGGDKFARVTGTQLSSADAQWLEFFAGDPNIIYAGTRIGVFRSDDGGVNWRWIFFETLPQANHVLGIAIDPNNADRVTISTGDGLYRTPDGGKSWERSGAFMFTSQAVYRVVSDPNDSQHLLCLTYRNVWETFDWGETWQAMYINDSDWSPRNIAFDPREKGVFWVLTSSELLRLSPKPPPQPDPMRLAALATQLRSEPSLSDAMDAAFIVTDTHRGERSAFRARSRWAGLLPRITAFGGFLKVDIGADINATFLAGGYAPSGGSSNFGFGNTGGSSGDYTVLSRQINDGLPYWGAMASWDLSDVIFHIEEAPYGRYFGEANRIYLNVKYEIQRLYEERRRVLIQLITVPPDNLRALLALRLRLEELTAHLNMLTAGLFDRQMKLLEAASWTRLEPPPLAPPPGAPPPPTAPEAPPATQPGFQPTRTLEF